MLKQGTRNKSLAVSGFAAPSLVKLTDYTLMIRLSNSNIKLYINNVTFMQWRRQSPLVDK